MNDIFAQMDATPLTKDQLDELLNSVEKGEIEFALEPNGKLAFARRLSAKGLMRRLCRADKEALKAHKKRIEKLTGKK